MTDDVRDVGVSMVDLARQGFPLRMSKAKVTAVNAGPPKSVNLLVENTYAVPRVPYWSSVAPLAVNDAVYVLLYGASKRVVVGKDAV